MYSRLSAAARTTKRQLTFYDGSCEEFVGICHLPMADPFCEETRQVVRAAAKDLDITMHDKGEGDGGDAL